MCHVSYDCWLFIILIQGSIQAPFCTGFCSLKKGTLLILLNTTANYKFFTAPLLREMRMQGKLMCKPPTQMYAKMFLQWIYIQMY